ELVRGEMRLAQAEMKEKGMPQRRRRGEPGHYWPPWVLLIGRTVGRAGLCLKPTSGNRAAERERSGQP
ncbi:hypothetical protein ABZT11_34695, partial [Streptomyces avermitilis]